MPVSANTLFHFTSFETAKKILASKSFWPQYSLEHFDKALPSESQYLKTYIPMVCFCDLKLTQLSDLSISKHTKDFGNYGIGFKKSWGIRNKISPVVYVHENSISSKVIDRVIKKVNVSNLKDDIEIIRNLSEVVKFLKPYDGYWQKNSRKRRIVNYYDEREWRYIPQGKEFAVLPKDNTTAANVKSLNIKLRNTPLIFTSSDIKYIVIDKEIEKIAVAEVIRRMSIKQSEKTDLITKIITLSEIKEDF